MWDRGGAHKRALSVGMDRFLFEDHLVLMM